LQSYSFQLADTVVVVGGENANSEVATNIAPKSLDKVSYSLNVSVFLRLMMSLSMCVFSDKDVLQPQYKCISEADNEPLNVCSVTKVSYNLNGSVCHLDAETLAPLNLFSAQILFILHTFNSQSSWA
jgi:hypothetical protein